MTEIKDYKIKRLPYKKPLLIYDGDCHFCRYWVSRWRRKTDDNVEYAPQQEKAVDFPEIPLKEFQSSVQLILPSGEVFAGAEAVFKTLSFSNRFSLSSWLYRRILPFKIISEFLYAFIARHRPFFSTLTKWIWGYEFQPGGYLISRWLFFRFLGVISLIAFVSLWSQVMGLVGEEGILPAAPFLKAVANQYGPERFYLLPTLFWFGASDVVIHIFCGLGVLASLLLLYGFCVPLITTVLWVLYLSLFLIGRNFLSFQWDILLLEVTFLAIFLSSLQWKPKIAREAPPSLLIIFLFHLLLFKLMFSSGWVKLLSGDEVWRNLTALNFHYQTQPLSTWTAWYVHQLPEWFHKMSVIGMFCIELLMPLFFFFPRRIRYFAGFTQIFFMLLIMATGNYCFFNLITIALCLFLYDDSFWPKSIRLGLENKRSRSQDFPAPSWPKFIAGTVFGMILFLNIVIWPPRMGLKLPVPQFVYGVLQKISSFHLVNTYGLFAVMTTRRAEIIVEGSNDGERWLEYEFKYKPGDLKRSPEFVAPHQPRLDWQMWFAALGTAKRNPWFVNFCFRLLQGSKPVLKLIEKNPFPKHPPRYIRAMMYDYEFTDFEERKNSGQWWKISKPRVYLSPITLRAG